MEKKNEWKVIPISELPDDAPVIAISTFPSKSFATFHLTEFVIVPLDGDWSTVIRDVPRNEAAKPTP